MPEDLKLSQIGSSQLPPPLRGLHSPGVRKHCQIIFACYFRKSSITQEIKTNHSPDGTTDGVGLVGTGHAPSGLIHLLKEDRNPDHFTSACYMQLYCQ